MDKQFTDEIAAQLKAPFPRDDIKWRIGRVLWNSTSKERGIRKDDRKQTSGPSIGDKGVAAVLAYVNTNLVRDRLDSVCGPAGWGFDFTPVTTVQAEVMTAKGTLTILEAPPVSDIGEAGDNEKSKGAVRDSLKRAASLRGVAAYLAEMGEVKAVVTFTYAGWTIDESEYPKLANYLPGPDGPAPDRPLSSDLADILAAWYGDNLRASFAGMSSREAVAMISAGTKPDKETAQRARKAVA